MNVSFLRHVHAHRALACLLMLLAVGHLTACGGDDAIRPPRSCVATPDPLTFGAVVIGASDTLWVEIFNDGLRLLDTYPALEAVPGGLPPVEFQLIGLDSAHVVTFPQTTDRFGVVFTPESVGDKSAWLSLGHNDCPGMPILGRAESELCAIAPDTLVFGRVEIGGTATRSFTVTNPGTLPLVGNVSLNCPFFSIHQGGGPFVLDPAASHEVVVRFTSPDSGPFSCEVDLGTGLCGKVLCTAFSTQTWLVMENGSGDAPTIQAGIDSAAHGDTVLVYPGTYYENIRFWGKRIVLRSAEGPETTTIDGSRNQDTVVKMWDNEPEGTVLEGFTITGGSGSRGTHVSGGGGISVSSGAPLIQHNRIVHNRLEVPFGQGGGALLGMARPGTRTVFVNNLVADNYALGNGGGISIWHGTVLVTGNVFRNNIAGYDGGGVHGLFFTGSVFVRDNAFAENHAGDHGGGLYLANFAYADTMHVTRNLFHSNTALGAEVDDTGSGGGAFLSDLPASITHNTFILNRGDGENPCSGGGLALWRVPATIHFNIFALNEGCGIACYAMTSMTGNTSNLFWQNTPGHFNASEPSTCPSPFVDAAIIEDPIFCDELSGDFRLQSSSPAIRDGIVFGAFPIPGCVPQVSVTPR